MAASIGAIRVGYGIVASRALIGKKKGDSVEVAAPGGARSYEVGRVQFI